nr:hypothetical protein [Tanacetum cinerariifolium]
DEDVDEQPVQDLALNVDNVFQADDCDDFDSDIDEAPTTQTMFMENLSSTYHVYDEVGPSYDSDILSEPALYNGHEIIKDNHAPAIVHNTEDTLEMAEITRKKMNAKINDPECVTRKVNIAPHDYSKENFLATFTPQKQLTPEQIFWSNDLIKLKFKALKEQTTPVLYNGHEIIKDNHVLAIVHNTEDTLEIAEITRKKMNANMNDPECVTCKVKIATHDYSKENFLAIFTPQKQLTPE